MPSQTLLDARHLPKPTAARGQECLHARDGVMHLGPIARLGLHRDPLGAHCARQPRDADIQANPSYRVTSGRAQRHPPGARPHCVSLLALKPMAPSRHTSDPNLGGGARLAQATREESPINSTTTEEVE